jgi:hypothetical protein
MCWTTVSRQCGWQEKPELLHVTLDSKLLLDLCICQLFAYFRNGFQNQHTSSRLSASSALKFAGAAADMTALRLRSRFIYSSEETVPRVRYALLRVGKIKVKAVRSWFELLDKVAGDKRCDAVGPTSPGGVCRWRCASSKTLKFDDIRMRNPYIQDSLQWLAKYNPHCQILA